MGNFQVLRAATPWKEADRLLAIHPASMVEWLTRFLADECIRRRGFSRVVLGLSGGADSAVSAYLCARAFGPENVTAVRMPFRLSSPESLDHADLVIDALAVRCATVDITPMVDGYILRTDPDASPTRVGNVCARCRTAILYDLSAKLGAMTVGTSNKSERMLGYFTWHGDDAPAVNPLGDLFKTQVWDVARELGVPSAIVNKPPTADLVKGQTDEGDIGVSYQEADRILVHLARGVQERKLVEWGYDPAKVRLVYARVAGSHWKRHLPTVAMVSDSAINESYLRPVDY
ncbi:MAG: NAD+ synthase [Fimbriimonadaceae bacterium]|nr:NAD+ synthase [Fimbriimonadaceae bacterium]QYK55315.1 MAG: NAD+ synthase [Fimbriimonadaceae bacterium]